MSDNLRSFLIEFIMALVKVAVLIWACFLIFFQYLAIKVMCHNENSYCVGSRVKNQVYEGILVGSGGRVMANTSFKLKVRSRKDRGRGLVGGFSTDKDGRFCVIWADEPVEAIFGPDRIKLSADGTKYNLGPDRMKIPGDPEELGDRLPIKQRKLVGWEPPNHCQKGNAGVPWNASEDVGTSWQAVLMISLSLISLTFMLLSFSSAVGHARSYRNRAYIVVAVNTGISVLFWYSIFI